MRETEQAQQNTAFLHNVAATHAEFGDRYCTCRVDHQTILGSMCGVSLSRYSQVYNQRQCPGGCNSERPDAVIPESLAEDSGGCALDKSIGV